jgi:hypothetical protein
VREPHLRAGDQDREATAQLLRDALTEGRLSLEEFRERIERAFAAKTFGELDALVADLPKPLVMAPKPSRKELRAAKDRLLLRRSWRRFAIINAALWSFWGVVTLEAGGHTHPAPPILLTIAWSLLLFSRTRRATALNRRERGGQIG